MILHSDCNCFYASVEMCENPALRGKKVAVCGSEDNRHGIVLTASYPAKRCGVRTAMSNREALERCPDLICVPPRYELYLQYSHDVRAIYRRYTDRIEPYGMDENWLELPGEEDLAGEGSRLAEEIRRRVREEIGITVSVGVSYTKVFAKLGSDLHKPDGQAVITRENFRETVWPLPAEDLLWVGRATKRLLALRGIRTIGELANTPPERLRQWMGVNGLLLWRYACGLDDSPVAEDGDTEPVLSVGHGTTCVRDLTTEQEVWLVLYELAQDVSHRLRKNGLLAAAVQVSVRDRELSWVQYQVPLEHPTRSALELARAGFGLFCARYHWDLPVRALTIRGIRLVSAAEPVQTDLWGREKQCARQRRLDDAVDDLRGRFGAGAIRAASLTGELYMAGDRCEIVPLPGWMSRKKG